ncbi:MAG: ribosome biogenesis GTPase Der [Deltaproteobacteria bacterium]|nr:ribosome biogenesis GTPase Der [Deltaproteobacteria bacterium]
MDQSTLPSTTPAWRPPMVAIVGRPNVGKSTLFNRLVGHRSAITFDTPGVTRDRHDAECELHLHRVRLVDTGGFEPSETEGMLPLMRRQAQLAVQQADAIVFLVCAREGLLPADEAIAHELRRSKKPVFVAANKVDTPQLEADAMAFYALGVQTVFGVSAEHNRGILDLVDAVVGALEDRGHFEGEPDADAQGPSGDPVRGGVVDRVRVCFVGRPNVGKSTLVNRLLGHERVITADQPGTTRDAIDIDFQWRDRAFTLVDTAGLRRKRAVHEAVEAYSVSQAVRAMERSHVAVLVLDATQPLSDQDSKIAALVQARGRACVVAINKWDAIEKDTHSTKAFEAALERHLPFLEYVPRVFISARTGQRVERLFEVVHATFDNFNRRVPTWQFNRWLMALQQRVQAPTHRGRKLKMSYGAQLSVRPPKFVIIVNQLHATKASYQRFLTAQIREAWEFDGSPIRLEFKKKQSKRKRTAQAAEPQVATTGDETLDFLLHETLDDPETQALQASLLQPDDDDEFYADEDDDDAPPDDAADDLAGDWDDDDA